MADRFAIAAHRPGERHEARTSGDDAGEDEEAETDLDDAGQDGDDLDRRQMRKTRRHQQEHDRVLAGALAQLLEFIELAVKYKDRLGQRVISEITQELARNAARNP